MRTITHSGIDDAYYTTVKRIVSVPGTFDERFAQKKGETIVAIVGEAWDVSKWLRFLFDKKQRSTSEPRSIPPGQSPSRRYTRHARQLTRPQSCQRLFFCHIQAVSRSKAMYRVSISTLQSLLTAGGWLRTLRGAIGSPPVAVAVSVCQLA